MNLLVLALTLKLADASVVHTAHESDCAAAWRITSDDSLLWHFALKSSTPLRAREDGGILTIENGAGIVARDDVITGKPADPKEYRPSALRVHRPDGPCVSKDRQWADVRAKVRDLRQGDWLYVAAGEHLLVRIAHADVMADEKPRVRSGGGSTFAEAFSGHVFDDGMFATAAVTPEWLQQERAAIMRLRKTFGAQREAPELAIARWLQTEAPLPLAKLKNEKVVLLDFWGVWCQPCIAHMPALGALREAIRDERFVMIGVHTVTAADKLDAFLARNRYPAPIAVDTGETATRYAVMRWPTYVLIDKSGHVVSYGSEVPEAAQIEKLLR